MRVTLLGYASVLVEMAGATCLMDPVFFDPFEEGGRFMSGASGLLRANSHAESFDRLPSPSRSFRSGFAWPDFAQLRRDLPP